MKQNWGEEEHKWLYLPYKYGKVSFFGIFQSVWYVVTFSKKKKTFNIYFFHECECDSLIFDNFTHWVHDLSVILNIMYDSDCNGKKIKLQQCCYFLMILSWKEVTSKATNR